MREEIKEYRVLSLLPFPFWRWAVVPTAGLAALDCPGIPFYTESGARAFLEWAKRDAPNSCPILIRRQWWSRHVKVISE